MPAKCFVTALRLEQAHDPLPAGAATTGDAGGVVGLRRVGLALAA